MLDTIKNTVKKMDLMLDNSTSLNQLEIELLIDYANQLSLKLESLRQPAANQNGKPTNITAKAKDTLGALVSPPSVKKKEQNVNVETEPVQNDDIDDLDDLPITVNPEHEIDFEIDTSDVPDLSTLDLPVEVEEEPVAETFTEIELTPKPNNGVIEETKLSKPNLDSGLETTEPPISSRLEETVKTSMDLVDRYATNQSASINESFDKGGSAIADKMKVKPIKDLKSEIDLNDRFWFINELFNGNGEAFKKHIQAINHSANLTQAMSYITETVETNYDWKGKEDTKEKFLKIITRRFV